LLLLLSGVTAVAEEGFEHLVNVSLTGGFLDLEGDQAVDDSAAFSLHLGLDCAEHWSLEGVLTALPRLEEQVVGSYGARISRLQQAAGPGVDETSAIGVAVDALYHFTRWDRLDPYLSAGVGTSHYEHDFGTQDEPALRVGGGLMYHLSDRLALRADVRFMVVGQDSEANTLLDGGLMWTFTKRVADPMTADRLDTDADGLSDVEETRLGTNPFASDTDYDGLSDADEVNITKTNPLVRDTDQGKVADGHEVIEDGTDPLAADDDLTYFELSMQFEADGWQLRPEYYSDLDAIAAVLQATPAATARIEGHTDQNKGASKRKLTRLTLRRAEAIGDYLAKTWKIDSARLEAVGYGFDRPKAANDPQSGNPVNRRMEIYIRHTQP